MSQDYRYLFGPVRSRRLGRSLGIDLVPSKVCSWDCPYCQVGATSNRTVERREYVPTEAVLAEFRDWMGRDGQADCVTLAGSGEPTLHSGFGDILRTIRRVSPLKRVLLSNGSLFGLPEVRAAAVAADVAKATLSAWDDESLASLHQPHASLHFHDFMQGLVAFRADFQGEYWLEVFVVPGVNDTADQLRRVAALAADIRPDRIQLNTAVRPTRDGLTLPVPAWRLSELAELFTPLAEVVASHTVPGNVNGGGGGGGLSEEQLLALIRRHPSSVEELSAATCKPVAEIEGMVEVLIRAGRLRVENRTSGSCLVAI